MSGIFCFGRFRLTVRDRVLMKDSMPVSLGSRAFDLLLALVERAGETVNRDDLFELVWPDVIVTKVNLRVHVAGLRRALGDDRDGNRFIVSVAGRGYRFVAPVNRFHGAAPINGAARFTPATASASGAHVRAGCDDRSTQRATRPQALHHTRRAGWMGPHERRVRHRSHSGQ